MLCLLQGNLLVGFARETLWIRNQAGIAKSVIIRACHSITGQLLVWITHDQHTVLITDSGLHLRPSLMLSCVSVAAHTWAVTHKL